MNPEGYIIQWRIYIVKFWTRPPRGPEFFQFHAVFGKFWQNRMLAPPGELASPPRGNPGFSTVIGMNKMLHSVFKFKKK